MGNVMTYSGITVKIRAMQAKLLKDGDYEQIASMRSVPEVTEFLKEKPAYEKYLEEMDSTLYHRGNVERSCTSLCSMITAGSSVSAARSRSSF